MSIKLLDQRAGGPGTIPHHEHCASGLSSWSPCPSCRAVAKSTAARTRSDMSYLYSGGDRTLRLEARIHHESIERSVMHFKAAHADLLYKSTGRLPFLVELRYEAFLPGTPRNCWTAPRP